MQKMAGKRIPFDILRCKNLLVHQLRWLQFHAKIPCKKFHAKEINILDLCVIICKEAC
jgi:hypothetical protein